MADSGSPEALAIDRERLELERRRLALENRFVNRHLGAFITGAISLAAIAVSAAQIWTADIARKNVAKNIPACRARIASPAAAANEIAAVSRTRLGPSACSRTCPPSNGSTGIRLKSPHQMLMSSSLAMPNTSMGGSS